MSVQVENLEKNMVKLTIEVSAEDLEKALQAVYMKEKGRISLPGFRKGKVPRAMIEKMYGVEIFFEDAANMLITQEYPKAVDECGADVVSRPEIDIAQMEKGKPFIFTAEVAVRPEVTLGEYKGVAVTKIDSAVTEEELNAEIDKERKSNARTITVEDRAIEDGDIAVIDFEGFTDGVAFEGGKGENHSLVIGSHSFIEGFEEQLIGRKTGEELDVNVTFPEEYHAQELAGKPAVFKVKINEVKMEELPELDDEFAQDVSEFDTLAEYKEDVEKKLVERKIAEGKRMQESEAVDNIVEASQMEIPDVMIETQAQSMMEDFANRISQQGLSMEQYMQFSGTTMEQMLEQMKPEALKRIQSSLVLEEIAKKEDIQVSEEDIDAELDRMAKMYGMEADQLKEFMGDSEKESMKIELAVQKAVAMIMEHVVEKDADPE
ncbi:MAG: trigger factor [Lachnospiraceae bacterium]|jgi:trigger factor|nr:trigger factor [Lachnospiraceae bacterium]